jgi:hypothetical protein
VEEQVQVPAELTISNLQMHGHLRVTFEGHSVGGGFWERIKTAWFVLTGRAKKLYFANTTISGCTITVSPQAVDPGIEVG